MSGLPPLGGFHHVTFLASDPEANRRFYADLLGLRLVKRTVNQDAPSVYHLYYGDAKGLPGTILSFFPYPGASPFREGVNCFDCTTLAISPDQRIEWFDSLRQARVTLDENEACDGWIFHGPDHESLGLLREPRLGRPDEQPGPEARIVEVTARVRPGPGAELESMLTAILGLVPVPNGDRHDRYYRFGDDSAVLRVLIDDSGPDQVEGAGSIHHVAFRCCGDEVQQAWRDHLIASGLGVSPVMDRGYFRSIYFRSPGNLLFEIATDGPGFAVDEPVGELGCSLKLPPGLERHRAAIEANLPPLG